MRVPIERVVCEQERIARRERIRDEEQRDGNASGGHLHRERSHEAPIPPELAQLKEADRDGTQGCVVRTDRGRQAEAEAHYGRVTTRHAR